MNTKRLGSIYNWLDTENKLNLIGIKMEIKTTWKYNCVLSILWNNKSASDLGRSLMQNFKRTSAGIETFRYIYQLM